MFLKKSIVLKNKNNMIKTFKRFINEKEKDWKNVTKPSKEQWNTPKWDGVSLGKTKDTHTHPNKYFVYTHRAMGKLYDSPTDISKKDVEYIESTG